MTHKTSTCSTSNFSGGGESRPEGSSRGVLVLFRDMVKKELMVSAYLQTYLKRPAFIHLRTILLLPNFYLSISQRVQSDEAAKVSRGVWWRGQREIEREGRKQAVRDGKGQQRDELDLAESVPLSLGLWEVVARGTVACTLDTAPSAEERRSAKVIRLPKPRTDVRRLKYCKAKR